MERRNITSRRQRALFATAMCGTLVVAGCARLPTAETAPDIRTAASFATTASFAAPAVAWPQERWWASYGDAQLDRMVEEAMAGSPDLAAAGARLRAAEAFTAVAGAANKPQVSANAAFTSDRLSENHIMPPEATPQGWNDYGRATVDLRWEVDFWGKNRSALAAATSERDAAQAELAQARLLLASSIAADYAELARLYASLDTAQRSREVRSKTAALFAERAVLALEERIALQRNRLAALLGAGPDRGLRIARPSLSLDTKVGLPEQAGAGLLGRRPDIVAARLVAEAAANRIDQKKAEFYSNVNLMAFVGVQSLGIDMLDKSGSTFGSVGPAISLPIFTAGRLQGELRGAQARHAQAVANYNGTVSRAMQEVADAAVRQRALGARLEQARLAVDASSEAWRVASNRYEGGLASYLEVLVAEDGLLANMNTLTDLRSLSVIHDIALKRALGGGYGASQG